MIRQKDAEDTMDKTCEQESFKGNENKNDTYS